MRFTTRQYRSLCALLALLGGTIAFPALRAQVEHWTFHPSVPRVWDDQAIATRLSS